MPMATVPPAVRDDALSSRTVAAFAIGVGPVAILGLPFSVYLPPYISEGGVIAVWLVGLMFSISTLWDGVIDPLIGTWIDRSTARGTTHRAWMWRAAVPLALLLVVLVLIGDGLPLWLLLPLLLLFYSSFSVYDVAYLSWGSGLAQTSDASSRMFGAREWTSKLFLVVAFAAPAAAQALIPGLSLQGRIVAYASLVAVALPLALAATRRLPVALPMPVQVIDWRRELAATLRFRPLLLVYAIQFFNSFAFGTLTSLFVFFADGVLGLDGQSSLLLFATFIGGALSTPIWTWAARRWGKRRGMIAMELLVAFLMFGSLVAQPEGLMQALAFTLLLGSGFVGLLFIYGMISDLAPIDAARCGRDRTAFLFAITMLMQKIGVASAIAVSYALLDAGGFDAKRAAASADLIHWLFSGLPTLGWLVVVALLVALGRCWPREHAIAAPLATCDQSH
jgi:glycoside/pentoside/hexuronide:cation symporter, GPH family